MKTLKRKEKVYTVVKMIGLLFIYDGDKLVKIEQAGGLKSPKPRKEQK